MGRSSHLGLIILEAGQQDCGFFGEQFDERPGVAEPRLGGQGDQGGAVVASANLREISSIEVEEVAAEELVTGSEAAPKSSLRIHSKADPRFFEEMPNRDRRDLDSDHRMSLFAEPMHVEALAAQGNEDRRATRHCEPRPVFQQQGVALGLVKTELSLFPSFVPEMGFHDRSALDKWAYRALC